MKEYNPYREKALLKKIATGDETAFSDLYNQWQPQLSSFVFRITKSKEITAEVVQDVFLKIWMSREALVEVEKFKSYLYVVSRNQAINAFRKAMRELQQFQLIENKLSTENLIEPDDTEAGRLSLIDEAIEKLTPRQKEIYLLHRHNKLTYQEIATKLGIGRETVKTHLELAIKSITRYLQMRITLSALLIQEIIRIL